MQDTIFAIPSYRRAEQDGTAEYLQRIGVSPERIFIFVQTKEDEESYRKQKGNINIVYVEATQVTQARNNILNYFYSKSTSKNVLMMDDDVTAITKLGYGKIDTAEWLDNELDKAYEIAKRQRAYLIGIYPIANDFFMSNDISTIVTVNTVIGFVGGKHMEYLRFDETFSTKEDMELCARIICAKKKVLRFNYLGVEAKHRTNKGGCYELWKSGKNATSVRRLLDKYPSLFAKNPKREGELRIRVRDHKITI